MQVIFGCTVSEQVNTFSTFIYCYVLPCDEFDMLA